MGRGGVQKQVTLKLYLVSLKVHFDSADPMIKKSYTRHRLLRLAAPALAATLFLAGCGPDPEFIEQTLNGRWQGEKEAERFRWCFEFREDGQFKLGTLQWLVDDRTDAKWLEKTKVMIYDGSWAVADGSRINLNYDFTTVKILDNSEESKTIRPLLTASSYVVAEMSDTDLRMTSDPTGVHEGSWLQSTRVDICEHLSCPMSGADCS